MDRRSFLRGASAFGGLGLLAGRARGAVWCQGSPVEGGRGDDEEPVLVLLQLTGGNDGLSTVIPVGDDAYHRQRSTLRRRAEEVLGLDDYRGLHPEMRGLRELFEKGRMAIIEGVGYPRPNRSHFASYGIWHTADLRGRDAGDGWVGRLSARLGEDPEANRVLHVGDRMPYSLHSASHPAACFRVPEGYRWFERADKLERLGQSPEPPEPVTGPLADVRRVFEDARASSFRVRAAAARYRPRVSYPDRELGDVLRIAAGLIDGEVGARIISIELGGFDTHNDQAGRHGRLMEELDSGLTAFMDDLSGTSAGRRTLVMVFSEFGRRVVENASQGTDHGTAGPVFVFGEGVRGGLHGRHPSLDKLDGGDLIHTTDFRSIYATLIQSWFRVRQEEVLGARFPLLPLFTV